MSLTRCSVAPWLPHDAIRFRWKVDGGRMAAGLGHSRGMATGCVLAVWVAAGEASNDGSVAEVGVVGGCRALEPAPASMTERTMAFVWCIVYWRRSGRVIVSNKLPGSISSYNYFCFCCSDKSEADPGRVPELERHGTK